MKNIIKFVKAIYIKTSEGNDRLYVRSTPYRDFKQIDTTLYNQGKLFETYRKPIDWITEQELINQIENLDTIHEVVAEFRTFYPGI